MDSLIPLLMFQVGDQVQKGQVVCIIEAMKLMNEIEVCVLSFSRWFCFASILLFFLLLLTLLLS